MTSETASWSSVAGACLEEMAGEVGGVEGRALLAWAVVTAVASSVASRKSEVKGTAVVRTSLAWRIGG